MKRWRTDCMGGSLWRLVLQDVWIIAQDCIFVFWWLRWWCSDRWTGHTATHLFKVENQSSMAGTLPRGALHVVVSQSKSSSKHSARSSTPTPCSSSSPIFWLYMHIIIASSSWVDSNNCYLPRTLLVHALSPSPDVPPLSSTPDDWCWCPIATDNW